MFSLAVEHQHSAEAAAEVVLCKGRSVERTPAVVWQSAKQDRLFAANGEAAKLSVGRFAAALSCRRETPLIKHMRTNSIYRRECEMVSFLAYNLRWLGYKYWH